MTPLGPTSANAAMQAKSGRERIALALALGLVVWHFASFEVRSLPLKTDIRYFVYFAWRVADGATPHLDLFDPKTQLATFVGAGLHRLGEGLGIEPLFAIRYGYLALAALGAWLALQLQRRIFGTVLAGWIGALAVLAFGLLGELPAQGNVPKLIMTVCASAAALCAGRGRWFAAGVAAALAFMDWQIGAAVGVAVGLSAWLTGAGWSAIRSTLVGGLCGLLPFVLYFASRGALGEALDQTIVSAFFRGSVSAEGWSALERLRLVTSATVASAQGQAWLLPVALLGLPTAAFLGWRLRSGGPSPAGNESARDDTQPGARRALYCASLTHLAVLAFSLVDFQARGDSLVVLHGAAFFLALAVNAILGPVARRVAATASDGVRVAFAVLVVGLACAAARPGPLRAPYAASWHRETLDQQRALAAQLERTLAGRELALVERCEMLVLTGRVNPLPFIYWNAASWGHYRRTDDEAAPEALRRLLETTEAEAWIVTNPIPSKRTEQFGFRDPGPGWRAERLTAARESQDLLVYLRRGVSDR